MFIDKIKFQFGYTTYSWNDQHISQTHSVSGGVSY